MVCEHLQELENEIKDNLVNEKFKGQAWTNNCREWVYYDCYFNIKEIRKRIILDDCVADHSYYDLKAGGEEGFICTKCKDGIMGVHLEQNSTKTIIYR
jgi:hypothetical protein